jgi:hypothetical protein
LTRSPVVYGHDSVFENARLQPSLNKADDALVADSSGLRLARKLPKRCIQ